MINQKRKIVKLTWEEVDRPPENTEIQTIRPDRDAFGFYICSKSRESLEKITKQAVNNYAQPFGYGRSMRRPNFSEN